MMIGPLRQLAGLQVRLLTDSAARSGGEALALTLEARALPARRSRSRSGRETTLSGSRSPTAAGQGAGAASCWRWCGRRPAAPARCPPCRAAGVAAARRADG